MPEATTATTAAATTAATTTAATTTAATTTTAAQPAWHGFNAETDKDAVAYVTNKGWTAPQDVIKGYQNAEKLIGRDPNTLLQIPRADDPQGFLGVMDRLGRPATADKYAFDKAPEGVTQDEKYMAFAKDAFHKVGLTAAQAKDLVKANDGYAAQARAQAEKDYQLSVTSDKAALTAEWRGGAERMFNAASTAAKALGFTPEIIDALERANGYASTMKFFAGLGQRLGDDTFVSGVDKGGRFGDAITPEEAKVEWGKMQTDPALKAALIDKSHPRHAEAQQKQNKLFAIMFPEG